MTELTEKRVVAFIRVIADRCKGCLHRREEVCRNCDSFAANRIMRDIEADKKVPPKDYSLFTRMALIVEILRNNPAGTLLSTEIDLNGLCSNQLKQWTLKRMVRMSVIGRRLAFTTDTGYRVYRYFLIPRKQHKQESANENHNVGIGER